MDADMLQPDGRVIFPIRLQPINSSVNCAVTAPNEKVNSAFISGKSSRGTSQQMLASGWSLITRNPIVPVGLVIVTVFAFMEALPTLYRPGLTISKWLR